LSIDQLPSTNGGFHIVVNPSLDFTPELRGKFIISTGVISPN
jgi:hypothetical protein